MEKDEVRKGLFFQGDRTNAHPSTSVRPRKVRRRKGNVGGRTGEQEHGTAGVITYSSPELASLFAPLERVLLRERVG